MEDNLFLNEYRIKSIRLKDYDYSSNGAYYVTICTKNRECVFGEIINGEMRLSEIGKIVFEEWIKTGKLRKNIMLDEFVIMPNHFHAISFIENDNKIVNLRRDVARGRDVARNVSTEMSHISPKSNSLSTIIRSFKSAVSNHCHKIGICNFQWQSRFYEHIIHNETELGIIREYIINNPTRWEHDRNNSNSISAI